MKIDKEFRKLIAPLSESEFKGLAADIKLNGCRDPLVVWRETGLLIDGHNRFEICTRLGKKFKTVELGFSSRNQAKLWIAENQLNRRNLTDYQRIMVVEELIRPLITALAKQNQGKRTDISPEIGQKFNPVDANRVAAARANVGRSTYAKACKIHREAPKALVERVKTGEISIDKGFKELRNHFIEKGIESRKSRKPALPEGTYDLLVLDPPWQYRQQYDAQHNRGGSPYPSLSLDAIKALHLPLAKNAAVFLWTTQAFLPYSFELLTTWGLEYKQTLVWQKPNIGLGNYFRNDVEFCLFALKGKCPPMSPLKRKSRTTIQAPSTRHSEKPDCFYRLLDKLFTKCRKLDYFARKSRNGWSVFGNEVGE